MKNGINRCCFPEKMSLEECIILAKDTGFDGIELLMNEFEEPYLELHLNNTEGELIQIRNLADQYKIDIPSISTNLLWNYPLTDNNEKIRNKGIEIVRGMIDAAYVIGAETILVMPGIVTKEVPYDIAYNRVLEAAKQLGQYAKSKGIYIGLENVWNKFLLSPLEMKELIEKIDNDFVQVYFDAGNVLAYGYPDQWVSILQNHIISVHVKDYEIAAGVHGFRQLFEGDMDFYSLVRELKQFNYCGYLTAEIPFSGEAVNEFLIKIRKAIGKILEM